MKAAFNLIFVVNFMTNMFGQVDFKDPYCFQHPGSEGMALIDSMYPAHLFKTEKIKEFLQLHPEAPYDQFYEFHMHNYYKPNEKYFSYYSNLLQTKTDFKSLTFTEKGRILYSDLVIKGKIIDVDDYSDTCLFYKSTYKVEVLEIFKDNFNFSEGDTVSVKSIVGYMGGCDPRSFADSTYASPTHYETALEPGTTSMFGLSALWYYKVAVRNSINDYKWKDPPCFAHFVDPGFNLIKTLDKTEDIKEFVKSIEP